VIYISTFSKSLSPGLRVGWITAPRPIVRRLAQVKKISDLSTCSLSQWIVDGFLRGGFYRGHLQTIRQEYASRRDAMVETLQQGGRHGGLEWNTPNGGYFVWVRFPREVNAAALLAKSIEKGVAYSPGELFSVEERGHGCARLNFSASSREEIVTGVGHFLRAFRECYRGCQAVVKQEIEELRPIV
jgi:DNA-binding transcriptional MocR family regulator